MRRMWIAGVAMVVGACSSKASGQCGAGDDDTVYVSPSPEARVEPDACATVAACCEAGEAGGICCAGTSHCAEAFQYQLDYGYCSQFTYAGWAPIVLPACSMPTVCAGDAG